MARGKCDACLSWLHFGRRKLQNLFIEGKKLISAVLPSYWDDWHRQVEAEHLDVYHLEAPDNPDYITGMIEYVRTHEASHAACRSGLDAEQLLRLVALEASMVEQLEPEVEDVQNIAWHYSLKRSVEVLYEAHWNSPRVKTQYAIWDHMAPF